MNEKIQELISKEHRLESELSSLIFGAPEVRDGKLYVHYRDQGRQVTHYVGPATDDTYNIILKNNERAKLLKKDLKSIRHQLHELGYSKRELADTVKRNLDFARRNLALTIHSQAILEGVATTFAETEAIIDGAKVSGMTEKDIRKIINMKHAWEFIMDDDVVTAPSNFALLCQINKLVEEGFYFNAGKLRDVPVNIGDTTWQPSLPIESQVVENLTRIVSSDQDPASQAVALVLYVMRAQLFIDGNKRTAIIFANHHLIQHGLGLIYIPESQTEEFKRRLVTYYETNDQRELAAFLKDKCLLNI